MKETINKCWNKSAGSYNKHVRCSMRSKSEKKAWQEIFTGVLGKERLNILDVGTGPGIVAFLLAELGHNVTGVDLSEEMLGNARENTARFNIPVDFKQGDAENLPFVDESVDAVVSRYVLWTLPNPEKAIAEWTRVLKPDGKVVIVDGNWFLDIDSSLKRRIWRYLAMLLIFITEQRWDGDLDADVKNKLWSTHTKRPDADIEILGNVDFCDVCVMNGINRRTQTYFEHLKYGCWGDTFLVSGVKH
jgi:ubiquinone/menaquinone biosynthesis C-methylase UbiE